MAFIKVGNKVLKFGGKVVTNDPNPLKLPPFTIRCKFSSSETPVPTYSGVTWDSVTLVDADEHIWDITKNDVSWVSLLRDETTLVSVYGANSTGVTLMNNLFRGCTNLTAMALFDTSSVVSMDAMFHSCSSLVKIPQYDTRNVTSMRLMFQVCTLLTYIPLLDTHNVTDLTQTFYKCDSLKTIPKFDTSNVTTLQYTFASSGIECVPLLDTSKATDVKGMFYACSHLIELPPIDLSHVTTMELFARSCTSLKFIPSYDTHLATNFDGTFAWCSSLITAPSLDTSKSTTLNSMFQHCYNLETVGTYDASSATDIERMFFCCEKLKRVNLMPVKAGCKMLRVFDTFVEGSAEQHTSSLEEIPNWDWTKASTLAKVFRGCTELTDIPDLGVPTNATTCANMFENCTNVKTGILRAYKNLLSSTSITTHTDTFKNCGINTETGSDELSLIPTDWGGTYAPNPLNLPAYTIRLKYKAGVTPAPYSAKEHPHSLDWDTQICVDEEENIWDITRNNTDWTRMLEWQDILEVLGANTTGVTNMFALFNQCRIMTNVCQFDTSAVTDVQYMFNECRVLQSIPMYDFSNVTLMFAAFCKCRAITRIPRYDTSKVTNMAEMLREAGSLTSIPLFDTSSATNMRRMCQNCYNVQTGALALYTKASTQANPPTTYSGAFQYCGTHTTSGTAEIYQIPRSWGGYASG